MSDETSVQLTTEQAEEIREQHRQDKATQDRPQWLPEKFKQPEDLAKAYTELEKKLGNPSASDVEVDTTADELHPATTSDEAEGGPKSEAESTEGKVEEALEAKGLSLNEFRSEITEKGELSETSYERLEKAGFAKEDVDAYIQDFQDAMQYKMQHLYNEVFSEVGGQDHYSSMVQWAGKNLSQAEIEAYDQAVNSNNIEQVKLAVRGLHSKFVQSEGQAPKVRLGGSASATSGDTFESHAEVAAAFSKIDPATGRRLVDVDPSYRRSIEQKALRSNKL